jgi:hypothetical protein
VAPPYYRQSWLGVEPGLTPGGKKGKREKGEKGKRKKEKGKRKKEKGVHPKKISTSVLKESSFHL